MSFPRYGDQSEAFALTGGGVAGDLLLARRGPVVMLLDEMAMVSTLDVHQFEGLAGKAVSLLHQPQVRSDHGCVHELGLAVPQFSQGRDLALVG